MLKTFLTPEHIQIVDNTAHWQEAVETVARPLLDFGFITPAYVQKIFADYENSGPYFVIAPGIAMPHARPQDGVLKQGLSLLVVRQGVNFECENDPVRIIVMLCATDSNSHVTMLSKLAEILGDAEAVMALSQATDVAEISALIAAF